MEQEFIELFEQGDLSEIQTYLQNQNLHALKWANLEVSFHFIPKGAVFTSSKIFKGVKLRICDVNGQISLLHVNKNKKIYI